MNNRNPTPAPSLESTRTDLAARLQARRPEIDDALLACVANISDPVLTADPADPAFLVGRQVAIKEVLDYAFEAIEHGEELSRPIPPGPLAQAQRTASIGVSLALLLRIYGAGHTLVADYVLEESANLSSETQRQILRGLGSMTDHLMAEVASGYAQELERTRRSQEQRLVERVQRLLAGERVDVGDLDYNFDAWHLGAILIGPSAENVVRSFAAKAGSELLSVARGEETVWAWLGGRQRLTGSDVERLSSATESVGVSLAIGEPGQGIDGWRLTHHQAQDALLVSLHKSRRLTRYADVLLLAAGLRHDTMAKSLHAIYLAPLAGQRDGGVALRRTLNAYFTADHNLNAAAAVLAVDRRTIRTRLRTVEQLLGRPLHACHAELEVALRLEELGEIVHGSGDTLPVRRAVRARSRVAQADVDLTKVSI